MKNMDVVFLKVRDTPNLCDNCGDNTQRPVKYLGTGIYGTWHKTDCICPNCEEVVIERLRPALENGMYIRFTSYKNSVIPECLRELEKKYGPRTINKGNFGTNFGPE